MISLNYIDFDTWFDKYCCELEQDDMTDEEFSDYLCDKYESWCSEYDDMKYEEEKDRRLFDD